MKFFFAAVYVLGCLVVFLLCYSFKYSFQFGIYHLIMLTFLSVLVASLIYLCSYFIKNRRVAFFLSNTIAALFWVFLSFFYPVVIGSNHFWGNTITYGILKNYLTSFNSILSILPIEKWLLIAILISYFIIVLVSFYFIRIRKSFFNQPVRNPGGFFSTKRVVLICFLGILTIFIGRQPLLKLKRTMHFNQEPILYFAFGPMWETHSDQLLTSTHKKTEQDLECIKAVKKSQVKDKLAIIILLDALRSDHLPMYGYKRNTTPFLDSLYKENRLLKIKNSFSTSTNTIGGISGLFYSKDWNDFNYSQLNMMQYFQLSGYSTNAFLTGYHSGWYGLSAMYRGYCDNFYESTSAYHTATDDDLVTLKKIENTSFNPGSFTFIHLLSTHPVGKRNDAFRIYRPDKIGLNTNYKEALCNNYDNGILQGDYIVQEIFKKLQKENLLDKATIFIVGDHGDLMGEDGLYGHSAGLHEKLLEVPILIFDQDLSWYKETRITSLIDIAPTLSDKIFGNIPSCWQGRSLHKQFDLPFSTKVSASTIKTNLSDGLIYFNHDTLLLDIFDKNGNPQKKALKIDSVNWKVVFKKR